MTMQQQNRKVLSGAILLTVPTYPCVPLAASTTT